MKLLTLIFLLLAGFAQAQIDTILIDTTPYTKYAIISVSEYYQFNADISVAKGYDLNMTTERVYPMNPNKYIFNADSTALNVVVEVNPENQPYCPYPLLDINEIPALVDTILQDIEVELINQKTFDWLAKHYEKNGDKSKRWIFVNAAIDKNKAPIEIQPKIKVK